MTLEEVHPVILEHVKWAGPSRSTLAPSIHPTPIIRNMSTKPSPLILYGENTIRNNFASNFNDFSMSIIPREVTSLFDRINKLDEHNWATWKYHIKDNMEMCNLWEIFPGDEQRLDRYCVEETKQWIRRAQGKVDLVWKFWNMRCDEGGSVREHVGNMRTIHVELAELGIIIEIYLLASAMSKSLPPSYDMYVSTIFASVRDLDEADPNYFAQKIFEEEQC
ncbi:hypothetical protein EPUL_002972 [Erysiphe pulchra]|uniref:Uncharacterized protein n=1 Tax=Erysiphe pulchra TaxID=225359 RepID=A0A2S4PSA9_9PEZI|nr:hypothetical protein EPUL_002972 [Erysiphe pulchra]